MKKYIRASFNNDSIPDWLKSDKGAMRALNDAGIDLANCDFSKEKIGKVGDNYIAYLVKGTNDYDSYKPFVWIPGLYNDDNYVNFKNWEKSGWRDDGSRGYGVRDSKAIKRFPKKNLNIIDTVYINIASNGKPYREHYQDPRYSNEGKYAGQFYTPEKTNMWNPDTKAYDKTVPGHWSEQGDTTYTGGRWGKYQQRDKSGYVIPDPNDRLKKFHETEEGQTRVAQKASRELQLIFGQLVNLKDRLMEDFNANAGSIDTFGKNTKSIDYFREALYEYKEALKCIELRSFAGKEYYVDPERALEHIAYAKRKITYAEKSLETGITYSSQW